MEDLALSAVWNQQMSGKIEWSWSVRGGVDDVNAFLKGINLNTDKLRVPSENLANVDLK